MNRLIFTPNKTQSFDRLVSNPNNKHTFKRLVLKLNRDFTQDNIELSWSFSWLSSKPNRGFPKDDPEHNRKFYPVNLEPIKLLHKLNLETE